MKDLIDKFIKEKILSAVSANRYYRSAAILNLVAFLSGCMKFEGLYLYIFGMLYLGSFSLMLIFTKKDNTLTP
jgi:hypothetical protein